MSSLSSGSALGRRRRSKQQHGKKKKDLLLFTPSSVVQQPIDERSYATRSGFRDDEAGHSRAEALDEAVLVSSQEQEDRQFEYNVQEAAAVPEYGQEDEARRALLNAVSYEKPYDAISYDSWDEFRMRQQQPARSREVMLAPSSRTAYSVDAATKRHRDQSHADRLSLLRELAEKEYTAATVSCFSPSLDDCSNSQRHSQPTDEYYEEDTLLLSDSTPAVEVYREKRRSQKDVPVVSTRPSLEEYQQKCRAKEVPSVAARAAYFEELSRLLDDTTEHRIDPDPLAPRVELIPTTLFCSGDDMTRERETECLP